MDEVGSPADGRVFDLLGRRDDEFLGAWLVGGVFGWGLMDGACYGVFVGGGAIGRYDVAAGGAQGKSV